MEQGIKYLTAQGCTVQIVKNDSFNHAYSGMDLVLDKQLKLTYRQAKITPKKQGFFVTLWHKDSSEAVNIPYSATDLEHGLLIFVPHDKAPGFFVLNQSVCEQLGILKTESKPGKMGFRIYHPESQLEAKQARRIQTLMKPYFICVRDPHLKEFLMNHY